MIDLEYYDILIHQHISHITKLDEVKNFSILKYGIGMEGQKSMLTS